MNKLLPLLLLFSFSVQAQELLHCGADEMRIETLQDNPEVAKAVIERDAELEAFTRAFESSKRGGQIYTIPVVFHVIHKYGDENISRAQLLDGLDVLNATFRKQIPDTADIHPDFKPIHADCEIEFKLATKDPEGNCHSGINRIASELTNSGDHRVKDLIHWNPTMYLNVYIVSNAAGLAGHAVWPADADTIPEWDGIVMSHNYVGRIGTSDQTRSVVFAHECGHYLNLHHIWGGNNVPEFYYLPVGQQSNCSVDDLVGDTPNTIGWSSCNLNASSCGNVRDNVQNAMDYSYCNVMFTEGQKQRMRACLNSNIASRNNLWTPANLAATGVTPSAGLCGADFEVDERIVCPDFENTVTFTEASFHSNVDSVRWTFEGGTPATSTALSPSVMYTEPGAFDVTLTVYANGQSVTETKQGYITVHQDSTYGYPFWDWFEGFDPIADQKWTRYSLDDINSWTVTTLGYHSSSHSLLLENWDSEVLTVDELISPRINIGSADQMRMAFKYAFAGKEETSSANRLQVQIRRDCESNWTTRLSLSGSSLETAPPQAAPFGPVDEIFWQQEDITIPGSFLTDAFQFRFLYTSAGGNRLFIDDVNVDLTASVEEISSPFGLQIRPNPASDHIIISLNSERATDMVMEVFDAAGKQVGTTTQMHLSTGKQTMTRSVNELSAGIYTLRIIANQATETKRFMVK